jgi:hypothetical protein
MQFAVRCFKIICILAVVAMILTNQHVQAQFNFEQDGSISESLLQQIEGSITLIKPEELESNIESTVGVQGTITVAAREKLRDVLLHPERYLSGTGDQRLLQLVDLLNLNPESRDSVPRMEAFVEPGGELHVEDMTDVEIGARSLIYNDEVNSAPKAPSKANFTLPAQKHDLSPTCNNKLSYFWEYQLSCKAQHLGMTKVR